MNRRCAPSLLPPERRLCAWASQALVEWQLTMAEEQQYGRMEMSSLERACGETAPLHMHQLMLFADNAMALDVFFAEAATADKAAALGYGPNAQRQAVRAAAAVLQLVTSRIALADALRETRTLAAVYVTQVRARESAHLSSPCRVLSSSWGFFVTCHAAAAAGSASQLTVMW